ncbi:MAG: DNA-directed RNA polymerase subunit alpha C-terminal domain-containing protein, partial [Chloroflexota bacterium]
GEAFDGFVPLDANFSPISRVIYDVDAARVRQKTNYDKLVLEIWTDGTLSPEQALGSASIVMIRYLLPFDPESAGLLEDPDAFRPPPEPEVEDPNPLYDVPIEVLDLSTRVFNSLRRTGITSVGDVIDMLERGEDAMLAIRNFGQTSLDELKEKLIENGYMTDGEDEANGEDEE